MTELTAPRIGPNSSNTPYSDNHGKDGLTLARPPIVLCDPGYYGTLAAVRSLGRSGVPVITAGPAILAQGRYSSFSSQHLRCPAFEKTDKWVEWLMRLGRSGPRRVIYATSDAVSFALASYRDELSAHFDVYQPDLRAIMGILDKGQLYQHCREAGVDTPDTWLPQSVREAARIAREAGGKILIKPRSQLAVRNYIKGVVTGDGEGDTQSEYERLMRYGAHDASFSRQYPEVMLPLLQRYHPEAMEMVYSLSGFRDRSGAHMVMRGARKVLQRPRQLGVGLCFEDAAVPPEIALGAKRLCEHIGYYGVFELEYILSEGRALLIDFNGRFYNQIAFDIARGMNLPAIAYNAAADEQDEMTRLISAATESRAGDGMAFCNRFGLAVSVGAQRAWGTMSPEEATQWRQWHKGHKGGVVDAVHDAADPIPTLVDAAQQLWRTIRHPRAFTRQIGFAK